MQKANAGAGWKGLNLKLASYLLEPTDSPSTVNTDWDEIGVIAGRKGSKKVNTSAFSYSVNSIIKFNSAFGDRVLIGLSNGSILDCNAETMVIP